MSAASEKIHYESQMQLTRCLDYLESILHGLRAGQLTMSTRQHTISLSPGAAVEVELKAETKTSEHSLAIHLSWIAPPTGKDSLLVIPGDPPQGSVEAEGLPSKTRDDDR